MEKQNENTENAVRLQTSILNPLEKRALVWLASHMPSWVTSDALSYFSLFGAVVIALGYYLTNYSPAWLWLASLGFVLHWFGDSLDGTLARYRGQSRPLYGFYIDHNLDCVSEFFIFGGMGFSAYMHMWMGLLLFCVYLGMEVYVMICAHLKNEFKLTYGIFGPTELRVLMIIFNTVLFFARPLHDVAVPVKVGKLQGDLLIYDIVGGVIFLIMCYFYFSSLIADGKYFARLDPLKKK